jgi:hypothetical protein
MNRFTTGAAIASLALATTAISGAIAKPSAKKSGPSPKAHTYHAELRPVAVGPYGMIPATRGHAQLVDGKKNNKVSIHLRGLQAGWTYTWLIHRQVVCITAPCNPPEEPGWTYKTLRANEAGEANSKATSSTFSAEPGATYLVDVHLPSGEVLAQGAFASKQQESQQPKPADPKPAEGKGPKPDKGKVKPHPAKAKGPKH